MWGWKVNLLHPLRNKNEILLNFQSKKKDLCKSPSLWPFRGPDQQHWPKHLDAQAYFNTYQGLLAPSLIITPWKIAEMIRISKQALTTLVWLTRRNNILLSFQIINKGTKKHGKKLHFWIFLLVCLPYHGSVEMQVATNESKLAKNIQHTTLLKCETTIPKAPA